MAITSVPIRYQKPEPASLGQLPSLDNVIGGVSLQTILLLLGAAYLVYRMFFSSPAKRRREELAKARDHYYDEVRKIKDRYR